MNNQHKPFKEIISNRNFYIHLRESVIPLSNSFADLNIIQILKRIFWEVTILHKW